MLWLSQTYKSFLKNFPETLLNISIYSLLFVCVFRIELTTYMEITLLTNG